MWTLGSPSCSPLFLFLWLTSTLPFSSCFSLSLTYTETGTDHKHAGLWVTPPKTSVERLLEINWSNPSPMEEGLRLREGRVLSRGHTACLEQDLELSPGLSFPLSSAPHALLPPALSSLQLSPSPHPIMFPGRRGLKGMDMNVQLPLGPLMAHQHTATSWAASLPPLVPLVSAGGGGWKSRSGSQIR